MKSPKSKMTELGPLPEDWEVKRLGDVCSDYAYGTGAEAVEYDGKNKYIRITDIDENSHLFTPSPLTSPSSFSEGHVVKENDLLVARTGASVGKTYFYSTDDGKLIFAGFLMKANVKEAEGKFVFYLTLTDAYKKWVLSESARSGQPGINIKQLKNLLVPLPPLPEQRRIAGALSDVDELISALGKLIEKKRNIKTGTMQQLLTGKRRLPGFGGAKFKQTDLGPIPEDWEVKRLGEVCEVYDGTHQTPHYVDNGIPFYSVENITANDFTNVKHISEEEHIALSKRAKIERGDILMTRIGSIGVCRYLNWDVEASYYVSLALLKKKQGAQINMCFLACSSESKWFKDEVWLRSLQFAIPLKINLGKISEIRLCLPPLPEQRAIAAVLSDMDAEIAALEAEQAKYARIKSGMMQQLLTGKTRLEHDRRS